jgi:hypothetical protein
MGRPAIPPALAYNSSPPDEGTRHASVAPSGLATVMLVREREASQGVIIGERFCPLCTSMEYHIVKRVLTRRCLPHGKVMMLFRLVP